ncbi:MAG: hypothetical protein ACHQT6_06075 [Candidatus Acidiferrales bacterium]
MYRFFDSHNVGVEAVETNPPLVAKTFVENAEHSKITTLDLTLRRKLLPRVLDRVLLQEAFGLFH